MFVTAQHLGTLVTHIPHFWRFWAAFSLLVTFLSTSSKEPLLSCIGHFCLILVFTIYFVRPANYLWVMKIRAVVCAALCLECRWWAMNDWPALLSLAAQCIRLLDVELWGPTIYKVRKQNVIMQEMSFKAKISAFKTFYSIKCKHREAWHHLGKGTLAFNTWVTSIGAWWFLQTSPSQMCRYDMQAAVLACSVKCMNKT